MPRRSILTQPSDSLLAEVSIRLPLFDGLASDTIQLLTASGFGRGFLTPSLRGRLRKAELRDLGNLAQSSPEVIASVRKFGPIRVEHVRNFILDEIARRLPGGRARHTSEATRERRLDRLRSASADRLPLDADRIEALGLRDGSCAEAACRSRLDLIASGIVTSFDVDRIVATLAQVLRSGTTITSLPLEPEVRALAVEAEAFEARRSAVLAEQDREWEAAAPAEGQPRSAKSRKT
jgi:hypothetical protein